MSEQLLHLLLDSPGERLDRALARRLPHLSRTRLQRLIADGRVTLAGEVITRPGTRLASAERAIVRVPPPPPARAQPESIPLDILFEDDNLIVVNKPAGMVVHPAPGHSRGTLVNALLAHAPELHAPHPDDRAGPAPPRPGIVHRLDRNTSGLIIVARNDPALRALQAQFKARTVDKVYLALVDGLPPTPAGRIHTPIGRHPRQRKRMAVVPEPIGRPAVTDYRTLEQFSAPGGPPRALLEARPHTGRTHQIRVHLAYLGCPVCGDTIYGPRRPALPGLERHFLHAARLTLQLPGQSGRRTFEAPLPPELVRVLEALRSASAPPGPDCQPHPPPALQAGL